MEKTEDNKIQNKKSFLLYLDFAEIFENLSDEEAGILIKAIFFFVHTGEETELEKHLKFAFIPIKQSLKRDLDKWRNIKEGRVLAGSLGGKKKAENLAKLAKGSKTKQSVANLPVNVNGIVSVNVNVKEELIYIDFFKKYNDPDYNFMKLTEEDLEILYSKYDKNIVDKKIYDIALWLHKNTPNAKDARKRESHRLTIIAALRKDGVKSFNEIESEKGAKPF